MQILHPMFLQPILVIIELAAPERFRSHTPCNDTSEKLRSFLAMIVPKTELIEIALEVPADRPAVEAPQPALGRSCNRKYGIRDR